MVSIRAISSAAALLALAVSNVSASSHLPAVRARDEAASFVVNATLRAAAEKTIVSTGAQFIMVHFSQLSLAEGDVVSINDADGKVVAEYTGLGRANLGNSGGFLSTPAFSDRITVQYKPSAVTPTSGNYGFTVDKIVRSTSSFRPLTICNEDQMVPPKCYLEDPRALGAYAKSQAVVRLNIGGKFCTGWLIGSQGYMMTNNHCIASQTEASNANYEFEAESPSCEDTCGTAALGCPGVIAATTATFVYTNKPLDYTIVKLDTTNDLSKYGFLKLRVSGGVDKEQIYIPQHPNGRAKTISLENDNGDVVTATLGAQDSCGTYRVGYDADTESGSSGAPVVAVNDNLVIGLHSCGTADTSVRCVNTGVDIRSIIYDMKQNNIVPPDALDDPSAEVPIGPWIPVTSAPTPAPTTDGCAPIKGQFLCLALGGKCLYVDGKCIPNPNFTSPTPVVTPVVTTPAPTPAPTTPAPTTPAPTTPTPTTPAPTTPAPTTPAPTTPAPTTPKPEPKSLFDGMCKCFSKRFCFALCKWSADKNLCVGI